MIIDTIGNMERYFDAVPALKTVFQIFSSTDWLSVPDGSYTTDDKRVRYNVFSYSTEALFSEKAEYHKKEIDVQILISGRERMDVSPVCNKMEIVPYQEEKEAGFVRNERIIDYSAEPGIFALFFPGEPHAPCLRISSDEKVKKVVFKLLHYNQGEI